MKKCLLVFLMVLISFTLCGCSAPKEETFTLTVNELNEVYAVGEEITVIGSITNNSLWTYTIGSGVSLINIYSDEDGLSVQTLLLYITTFHEHEIFTEQCIISFATPGEHIVSVGCWFIIDGITYRYQKEIPVTIQSI